MEKLRVCYVSTSQLSFPGDKDAQIQRSVSELQQLAHDLNFALHVIQGTVITEDDARKAVKEAEEQKTDFLLIQNTSFSAGFLIPVLARIKNANIGLWAIPEGAKDGPIPFNSFCSVSMYASIIGHYLNQYHIPFKWYYGFSDDDLFMKRFTLTIRALSAIKNLRQSKVALIGGIAPGFNDLYFDERVLEKIYGVSINRLHEFSEIRDRALKYKTTELQSIIAEFVKDARAVLPKAETMLETNARVYKAYQDFLQETGYHSLAISCWPKFQQDFNFSVCSVVARLNDEGIVTACEGDLPSALSMLILKYLANDETNLMDLSGFDEADQTVLLWHCGPSSKRFAGSEGYALGVNYHALPHEKGKEPNSNGITRDMVFGPHQITCARVAGEGENLFLMDGQFSADQKKSFSGSRGWLGKLRFNREPITVRDLVNTILVQRFPHHFPLVRGEQTELVMEFAAWLGLNLVAKVPYENYLQAPLAWK